MRRLVPLVVTVVFVVLFVVPLVGGLGSDPRAREARAEPSRRKAPPALVVDHACVDAADAVVPKDALTAARALRVVFGHQSVGFDVLRGLRGLAEADADRYALEIEPRVRVEWYARRRGVGEFVLGQNGDALGKVDAFAARVRDGLGDVVDVAMMKLCYADLTERADPKAIFARWKGAYEDLERAFPKVRFVWWTVPVPLPERCADRRTELNDLIRAYVRANGKTLLDVADLESHAPDGKAVTHAGGGEKLFEGYARDAGGHLNDVGAQRVARAWWWLMARIAGWAGPK